MSPRPYNLGKRADDIDRGRRQILDAARSAFREATSYTAFTLDAVAKRADVARGTVYYQFGPKVGLLEAVCDDLGASGGLADLSHAFSQPEPATALAEFIACFGRFWDADRAVMRRLRALAALDPDVHAVIAARDQRRHDGLGQLLARFEADPRAREADRQRAPAPPVPQPACAVHARHGSCANRRCRPRPTTKNRLPGRPHPRVPDGRLSWVDGVVGTHRSPELGGRDSRYPHAGPGRRRLPGLWSPSVAKEAVSRCRDSGCGTWSRSPLG